MDSAWVHLPTYLAASYHSPSKNDWFASRSRGGGYFLAMAPHELDRLLWLFGPVLAATGLASLAAPAVALADGSSFRIDAPDSYHALLEFASGLIGLAALAPVAWAGSARRLEVHGDAGSLLLEEAIESYQVTRLARSGEPGYGDLPLPEPVTGSRLPEKVFGAEYVLIDCFIRAILDGDPMSPDLEEGCRTQELIEAIIRSGETGRRQLLPLD